MKYFSFTFLFLFLISTVFSQQKAELPKVWMTYYDGDDLVNDFSDMKAHGVDAVEVGVWGVAGNSRAKEVLKFARETNMKLIIGIPEVSEEAFNFQQDKVERAVMMGGAYKGKAIDRFRFSFSPEKHTILIESPVYDSTNCYGNIGRYFMGLTPVKAEVIVKNADFDGEQHLQIIPAKIAPEKEHFWAMQFDLSDVEGDLENVVLAVYWTSEGTRDYWIFGDAVSMYSEGFKKQLQKEVRNVILAWKDANNGSFPLEIVAVRYGDECFHISGHLNSDDCSFPMWDFSKSAIQQFKDTWNGEYPRGVGWTDMFGHEAYAHWMYNFHEAAAQSVNTVKSTLVEENVGHLPVFRNMTRMNIFDVMNDWDGSGLDLLSKEFDILHLDPYPVNDKGYDEKLIPRDMNYVEGLSRRYNKPVVPWLQAHVYGQLQHPDAEDVSEMVTQQMQFNNDAIIWLGYGGKGSGNTFPNNNRESWEQAKIEHARFKNQVVEKNKADFAVIRPYTTRSLRAVEQTNADHFLTDVFLEEAVFNLGLKYDPYEPLICSELKSAELKEYSFLIAEMGIVSNKTLNPFLENQNAAVLIIDGAEMDKNSLKLCGIKNIIGKHQNGIVIDKNTKFKLSKNTKILYKINNQPVAWKYGHTIFVGHLPDNNLNELAILLLKEFPRQ